MSNDAMDSLSPEIIERAQNGDQEALSEVRDFVDLNAPELWRTWGDVAADAQRRWVDRISEGDAVIRDCLDRSLSEFKSELAEGRAPSPLESLLIHRIALNWLHVYDIEASCVDALRGRVSMSVSEHRQRLLNKAQRRFLAAIKSLAQVRRLIAPAVQINLAERQVNIAGSVESGSSV